MRAKTLKEDETRGLTVHTKHIYKFQQKLYPFAMSLEIFTFAMRSIASKLFEALLYGYVYNLPMSLGSFAVNPVKCEFNMVDGRIARIGTTFPIDYPETKKKRDQGINDPVYDTSFTHVMKFRWKKGVVKNKGKYIIILRNENYKKLLDYAKREYRRY